MTKAESSFQSLIEDMERQEYIIGAHTTVIQSVMDDAGLSSAAQATIIHCIAAITGAAAQQEMSARGLNAIINAQFALGYSD